jgi:hypothetical protein
MSPKRDRLHSSDSTYNIYIKISTAAAAAAAGDFFHFQPTATRLKNL